MILTLSKATHVFERNVLSYRRNWFLLFAGFFEPIFYLLGLGAGLGQLIGEVDLDGQLVSYAAFVTPGLIAASAMNGAVMEASFNFFYKLKYAKTFEAMLVTPLSLENIVVGEVMWAMSRGTLYAGAFLVVAAALGFVTSWWAILCVPAALLIGIAFCSIGLAGTSYMKSWHDFDYIQLILQPMFLASTTFYPLSVYPEWARPLVMATPLYHGVALCRDFAFGTIGWADLGHIGYLVAMTVVGAYFARKRLGKLLLS